MFFYCVKIVIFYKKKIIFFFEYKKEVKDNITKKKHVIMEMCWDVFFFFEIQNNFNENWKIFSKFSLENYTWINNSVAWGVV